MCFVLASELNFLKFFLANSKRAIHFRTQAREKTVAGP